MGVTSATNKQANGRRDSIDLAPTQLNTVRALLQQHLPNTEVWAYGSRVQFTTRPSSDLDLVAFANKKQANAVPFLLEAFEDSDLPFTVDLFIWRSIPAHFKKSIKREYFIIQET